MWMGTLVICFCFITSFWIGFINCDYVEAKRALIIIDVQLCFTKGGTLEVTNGDQVIPLINRIRVDYEKSFDLVVFSQDWHCSDHVSFYSEHPGHQAYDVIPLYYSANGSLCLTPNTTSHYAVNCSGNTQLLEQTLWPAHCVINTTDADIHSDIIQKPTDKVVRKGYSCQLDSYSVFYDNGNFGETEMNSILRQHNINTVFVTGLARDYCVYYTSLDALELGYKTYMILDATRPVSNDTGTVAVADMISKGVYVINAGELGGILGAANQNSHPSVAGVYTIALLCIIFFSS